jgi:hypothetical protein
MTSSILQRTRRAGLALVAAASLAVPASAAAEMVSGPQPNPYSGVVAGPICCMPDRAASPNPTPPNIVAELDPGYPGRVAGPDPFPW